MSSYSSPFQTLHETSKPAREALHKLLLRQALIQSCLNCDHWKEDEGSSGRCSLFKALPPSKVIVFGCEKWEEQIPF